MPRVVTDSGQCVPSLLSDFSAPHAVRCCVYQIIPQRLHSNSEKAKTVDGKSLVLRWQDREMPSLCAYHVITLSKSSPAKCPSTHLQS